MVRFCRLTLTFFVCWVMTLQCCLGNEDSDCSYWYFTVPSNNSECNPNGIDVLLQCGVSVPHDNYTNVTVNWYRSTGTNQVQLRSNSLDYFLVETIATQTIELNISGIQGLFLDIYHLFIHSFDTSDNGFYWCEIQVNNTSLLPSPSAYVAVNSINGNHCTVVGAFDRYLGLSEIICAENRTITNSPMASMTPSTAPTTTPVDLVIIIAPAAGGFVILVVIVLLLIACCCACRRRRKQYFMKTQPPTGDIPLQPQVKDKAPAEYEDLAEYDLPRWEEDKTQQGSMTPDPSQGKPGCIYQELTASNVDYTTVYQQLVSGGGQPVGGQEYSAIDISKVDPPSEYAIVKEK